MTPWFERDRHLYSKIVQVVESQYPTLHLSQEGGTAYLRGRLNITAPPLASPVASYDIELEFPSDYPDADPLVRETAGIISKDADHHFYNDGSACLFLPEARWRQCPARPAIAEFIEGPVKAFFAWHAHLALTGHKPPSGDWRHGIDAILLFYFEELQTRDVRVVRTFLGYMTAKKVRNHWRCYCGSGRPLPQCHMAQVQFLRARIPRARALSFFQALQNAFSCRNGPEPVRAEPPQPSPDLRDVTSVSRDVSRI